MELRKGDIIEVLVTGRKGMPPLHTRAIVLHLREDTIDPQKEILEYQYRDEEGEIYRGTIELDEESRLILSGPLGNVWDYVDNVPAVKNRVEDVVKSLQDFLADPHEWKYGLRRSEAAAILKAVKGA